MTVEEFASAHPDTLLTTSEAAKVLAVPASTLYQWRHYGRPDLRFVRIAPRTIRYRVGDIRNFLSSRLSLSPVADGSAVSSHS